MKDLLPAVKAKIDPALSEAKKDLKPVGQSVAYLFCWVFHLLMLPFSALHEVCKKLSKKYEPELKSEPKEESKAE